MPRLLTALLLLFATAAAAQRVETVQLEADLMLTPGTFLLRDTPAIQVYMGLNEIGDTRSWNRQLYPSHDSILRAYRSWGHEPLRISALSKAPASKLLRGLRHEELEVPGTGYSAYLADNEHALISVWGGSDNGRARSHAFMVPITVLSINGGHKLISIPGFGYLLHTGRYRLFHNGRETAFERRWPDDIATLRRHLRQQYPDGVPFSTQGRSGLRTQGGRILVPAGYDSIRYAGAFIAAHSGGTIDLYFRNGERLPHRDVRAVRIDRETGGFSIAQGTASTHWLDADGNPTSRPMNGYCGTGAYHRVQQILRRRDSFWLHGGTVSETDTLLRLHNLLAADTAIADISFLNGTHLHEDRGVAAGFRWPARPLFVRYRNGHTGIAEPSDGGLRFLVPAGPYRFQDLSTLMRFDGPAGVGVYPLHPAPRFRTLGAFDKGFARYTLPDGSTGWVDDEGREYPDQ
ncbi:hypothetical protein [Flaviaesturariibacter amylovorans]|uniref:Uncharacterized protein n=1 Tax=Flaviaesturariibacter amylovorans TaxID=1084520 RepID=A0ABP8HLZ0_9BACT